LRRTYLGRLVADIAREQVPRHVVADDHQDFVLPRPDVWFDGQIVIAKGRWVAPAVAAAQS